MHRIPSALTAFLLLSASVSATEIYTWQDEHGTTHFSDQPHPGASVLDIQLPEATTISQPEADAPTQQADTQQTEQPDEPALLPPSIQINTPSDRQTIRDNQGNLTVVATTNRKLNQGRSARLRLDGEVYGRAQTQLFWPLTNIDRGSHTLQVELLKHGKVIASSEEMTVFLHRARINQRPAPLPVPK